MVIVEAMESGLLVIATRGGGVPEIVKNGATGLLTERGDSGELAEAITRLVDNDDLRESMGRAGRKRALHLFSWEKISERLLTLYEASTEGDGQASTRDLAQM
jgi:glycosyltransferase involved in cell wall biosynthesis